MENQENANSAKHSLLSDRRDSVSSLNESRGIIVENPDGTYHHGSSSYQFKILQLIRCFSSKIKRS